MKIVLAGAYGKLGSDILRRLIADSRTTDIKIIAAGRSDHAPADLDQNTYTYRKTDVTDAASLKGLCDDADVVITTVGLTSASAGYTNYEIDYQGNLNLLHEAQRAGVRKFIYISVIKADQAPKVPMLHAKYLFEEELKKSGIDYVIHRPTGYFYDIVKVFRPMIEKGEVSLLGHKPVHANVIDTPDLADFIVEHIEDTNVTYNIGGKETWSYEEIARMCFEAAGKKPVIKYAPPWLFDLLSILPKNKKNGKQAVICFSKWTLTQEMVGDTVYGEHSFKQYIKESFTEKTYKI